MRNNGYRKGRFHKGNASRLGKLGVAARAKKRMEDSPCQEPRRVPFSYPPAPDTLTVEDDVVRLDGKIIDADHAEHLADLYGFVDEGETSALKHLKQYLSKRQQRL